MEMINTRNSKVLCTNDKHHYEIEFDYSKIREFRNNGYFVYIINDDGIYYFINNVNCDGHDFIKIEKK